MPDRVRSWRPPAAGLLAKVLLVAGVVTALAASAGGSAQARTGGQAAGPVRAAAALPARHPAVRVMLSGVSCTGPSFCMAVGRYSEPGHLNVRLAEEWNGRTWRIVRDPLRGNLLTISCGSPSFCVADRFTVHGAGSEHLAVWNGRTWQDFRDQPADVYDVSCGSPAYCVTFSGSRIAGWTGKRWKDQAGSLCNYGPDCRWDRGGLRCATATNCVAEGTSCVDDDCDATVDFSAAWNGSKWDVGVETPFAPSAEDCAGRSFCMITAAPASAAVSRDWGGTWQDVAPDLAVACHGAANCTLDGNLSCGHPGTCLVLPTSAAHLPVSLAWNGTTWTAARVARAHGQIPDLTALSCGNARNCIAIGGYQPSGRSYQQPVAEHWNGSSWRVTPVPVP
jgi:hypothetical protein